MRQAGGRVANHASWLDIFALNARKRVYFVSKSEVARWPGIGWLARATGTVFIRRDAREAQAQTEIFETRLDAGHKLLFFPEGTSTDGQRVLPFKIDAFRGLLRAGAARHLRIQPVTVIYTAPTGEDPRFYGWWGDMGFGPHLLQGAGRTRPGAVTLVYHPPVRVARLRRPQGAGAALRRRRSARPWWRGSRPIAGQKAPSSRRGIVVRARSPRRSRRNP